MKSLLGLLVACLFSVAVASEIPPDEIVKNMTNKVLESLRQSKGQRGGDTHEMLALVEAEVLPHFDFQRMTQLAMGREGRQATPEQLKVLTSEFRTLLVRTYSVALSEYRDREVSFKPLKFTATDTDVRVRAEVKRSNGKPVAIDCYLEKTPTGWKVYDVEVAGVSLVTNYRSSFSQDIQKNGIDGLIRSLQAKNGTGVAASTIK